MSHQGVLCRGRTAILAKLEETVRQQQQLLAQKQLQPPHGSLASAASQQGSSWQLLHVDRQPLLQVGWVVYCWPLKGIAGGSHACVASWHVLI